MILALVFIAVAVLAVYLLSVILKFFVAVGVVFLIAMASIAVGIVLFGALSGWLTSLICYYYFPDFGGVVFLSIVIGISSSILLAKQAKKELSTIFGLTNNA